MFDKRRSVQQRALPDRKEWGLGTEPGPPFAKVGGRSYFDNSPQRAFATDGNSSVESTETTYK
jgi:hypothetical protein